jgi:hypothetical protein
MVKASLDGHNGKRGHLEIAGGNINWFNLSHGKIDKRYKTVHLL